MYNYTDPKMQEVSKLCQRGFWPICKNEYGEFAIFTPELNGCGFWRRSSWSDEINEAKRSLGTTSHCNKDSRPTEIVGFYHPPTPQFKIGDKVRVISSGEIGIVQVKFGVEAGVCTDKIRTGYSIYLLEPVIEPEPVIVEMTLAQIEEYAAFNGFKVRMRLPV